MITLNGNTFIKQKTGVLIIPEDASYIRFISNSWYDKETMHGILSNAKSDYSDVDMSAEINIDNGVLLGNPTQTILRDFAHFYRPEISKKLYTKWMIY